MPISISPRPATRLATVLATALAGPLLLAGCGGVDTVDDLPAATPAATEAAFPVTVASGALDDTTRLTIVAEPTAIVSLSPTATEMLWAVGAGDQVVAVDDQSDFPAGVPTTDLSGYRPNVEAILEREPDLVVTASDEGDLVAGLEKARVPTLVLPSATDLEESYSQIERVGTATGHRDAAADVVARMRSEIADAVAAAPEVQGLTYFHELSPDLYSASGDTFIGEVYGLFGLSNVADEAPTGDDYPQLSAEYVVTADPDLVFLADAACCGVSVADVAERPGWQQVDAVADGQVHVLDEDIASRWGPRVVDFVQQVSDVLAERGSAPAPAGG